ncbi:hypothetical protein JCM11251_004426 [Rhodosporidiobolus azoricus]
MPIKLYDLVTVPGGNGRFFSPACVRTRLSLMTKGVAFEVVEVTYHDLRFTWKEKLGVEKATAPFIEREDGSLLMDSFEIAKWLDKTYPDQQNLFLPEAPLPVDVNSEDYKAAVQEYEEHEKTPRKLDPPLYKTLFSLYAPRIAQLFDEETREYWTSDKRLGTGVWKSLLSRTPEDDEKALKAIKAGLVALSPSEFPNGQKFVSSASKPGLKDFSLLGSYRLIRAVSPRFAAETFEAPDAGEWPHWLKRMAEAYPLPEYWERDPQQEVDRR